MQQQEISEIAANWMLNRGWNKLIAKQKMIKIHFSKIRRQDQAKPRGNMSLVKNFSRCYIGNHFCYKGDVYGKHNETKNP
jgi:hypothetical protein